MKIGFLILATFVLFSSLFMISQADALIVARSLEDLAEKAEFVVIGKVTEITPLVPVYLLPFTDGYDRFQFDVTLSIEDDLDGKYKKDTIVFRIHDSREEFGDSIEDEQNFKIGERVLVFIGEKEPDSVMGDAYLVYGVTQGKYLLKDGIAFGIHFPEGIDEDELILKIKNIRDVNENVQLDCVLTEYPNGTKCVPIDESLCGLGAIYQDGIVSNSDPDPILTSVDYGLIYMTILLVMGISGCIVGGIIFIIRRKRK